MSYSREWNKNYANKNILKYSFTIIITIKVNFSDSGAIHPTHLKAASLLVNKASKEVTPPASPAPCQSLSLLSPEQLVHACDSCDVSWR